MSSCITLHLSPRCILMSPFQPLPRSKTHMKPCPGGSPSQAASAGEALEPGGATALGGCHEAEISQAAGSGQLESKAPSPCTSPSPGMAVARNSSFLREALLSPGNITAALVEQLSCTGIPVIKSRRWLQCYSPTSVRKATRQGLPGTI